MNADSGFSVGHIITPDVFEIIFKWEAGVIIEDDHKTPSFIEYPEGFIIHSRLMTLLVVEVRRLLPFHAYRHCW